MTVDKRFALLGTNGEIRYPYIKTQRTGRSGFALSSAGNRDKHGGGEYTTDIEQVIRHVVFDGGSVRARTVDSISRKKDGSIGLRKKGFNDYWVVPELAHLVRDAATAPLSRLPATRDASAPVAIPASSRAAPVPIKALTPNPFNLVLKLTADDYIAAYEVLSPQMTPSQLAMLLGHASASASTLTMEEIAKLGGYPMHSSANSQYGRVGGLFSSHFRIEGLANKMQAIASEGPRDEDGHWQWTMQPRLVEAFENLGLIEHVAEGPGRLEATQEVNNDPQSRDIPETTKAALINARIGQGGYRKRMLRIWDGRCAVTDCAIKSVLIASHTKPWATSTNVERLDEYNGLLLAASVDRLFDGGLISFDDEGRLLVKATLLDQDLIALGINRQSRLRLVVDRHKSYLKYHRQQHEFY